MKEWLTTIAVLTSVLGVAGCSDSATAQKKPPAPPSVPVSVAEVAQRTVPLQVSAVGNVQAYTTVSVKSQVAGQIQQVHFTEGRDVKRGELLFTIDPRPFQASLRQTEAALGQRQAELTQAHANVARDEAQREWMQAQEKRYGELLAKELISREQYEQIRTNMTSMEATVRADRAAEENARAAVAAAQAAVDNARLQLGYTEIRSPIDGRTGNLLVQRGNVIKANEDNPMVVIAQVRPIYVSFSVPEQQLAAVKQYLAIGTLPVEARAPSQAPAKGTLTFVNNTVDPNTGTIQLKATFANAENLLWPGQFVETTLTLTSAPAIVVPSQAIQPGQQGPFVFVVKADATVEARKIVPGRRLERDTIVNKGLAPGERVVTDGHLRLVPGARVDIKAAKSS
jgi:multidrug efflux system membrane fusion protein